MAATGPFDRFTVGEPKTLPGILSQVASATVQTWAASHWPEYEVMVRVDGPWSVTELGGPRGLPDGSLKDSVSWNCFSN